VSLGPALNVIGMSIELLSVVLGGLALPQAEPIRSWMRGRLATRAAQLFYSHWWSPFLVSLMWFALLFGFTFAVAFGIRGLSDPELPDAVGLLLASACILVPGSLFFGFFYFIEWLPRAGDEALRNLLLLMGTLFGLGIALQLVSAIMG